MRKSNYLGLVRVFGLVLIMTLSLGFQSCSDDDPTDGVVSNLESLVLGEWEYVGKTEEGRNTSITLFLYSGKTGKYETVTQGKASISTPITKWYITEGKTNPTLTVEYFDILLNRNKQDVYDVSNVSQGKIGYGSKVYVKQ